MYVNEFRLLHIISIEKRRKRSIKTIHLKQQTGNMMPKQIRLFVIIIEDCILRMSLIEKINMGLNEHLKYTNPKIVRIAHYALFVQKRQRVKIESCFTMKNGKPKKNI